MAWGRRAALWEVIDSARKASPGEEARVIVLRRGLQCATDESEEYAHGQKVDARLAQLTVGGLRRLRMMTLARRSVTLVCWLAISGLVPGQAVRAAPPPPLAQGWTMVAMPARQGPLAPGGGAPYSRGSGAPTWLLTTRRGLVALGAGGCCRAQAPPNEWISTNGRAWQQIALPSSVFGQDIVRAVAVGRPGGRSRFSRPPGSHPTAAPGAERRL